MLINLQLLNVPHCKPQLDDDYDPEKPHGNLDICAAANGMPCDHETSNRTD
jgi:hypothetical protein